MTTRGTRLCQTGRDDVSDAVARAGENGKMVQWAMIIIMTRRHATGKLPTFNTHVARTI
jgi:hypothetical protein